jgi:hypothetical protein
MDRGTGTGGADMNAISFCLYGRDAKYAVGMIENARLAKEFYPGWQVVCHVERGHYAIGKLRRMGVDLIEHAPEAGHKGMLWRILTGDDRRFERVIFRDADSRIGQREVLAVEQWITSDRAAHVMRDHVNHKQPIMAGMWGIKVGTVDLAANLREWPANGKYGDDERFLRERIWPFLDRLIVVHDSHRGAPFPHCNFGHGYVGERVSPTLPAATTRLVFLSPEKYEKRRAKFLDHLDAEGGFLLNLKREWWRGTPSEKMLVPPAFKAIQKRAHWWAASCDHLAILESTLLGHWDQAIILEDDAHFLTGWEERFWRAWCCLPAEAKALRLAWTERPGKKTVAPGILDRCDQRGGYMGAIYWTRQGMRRFYDHAWHRRKLVIDMAFSDLRTREPKDWYQPAQPCAISNPGAAQQGRDS